jgi:predicted HicB family RNase H-like nuclease
MPSTSGKITVSVRLPEELDEWLRDEALLCGTSVSQLVEIAVRQLKGEVSE